MGGIDAVLDILIVLLAAIANMFTSSSTTAFIVIQLMGILIQYFQSVNHALVYNVDIREKIIGCITMRNKHSKVILLNRE